MFPELSEAVKRLITPKEIRWIGWSHFESDECGAQARAAQPVQARIN
jgi:flavorubredoxin